MSPRLVVHTPLQALLRAALVVALGAVASVAAAAQPAGEALDYGLFEEVQMIPPSRDGVAELEVTVFRPRGDGPFPVAIVNHGRSPEPAHAQSRYRPLHLAYELVRRGYAVVAPMRQGFAHSGGDDQVQLCDLAADARHQARSIRRAAQWAAEQRWADSARSIVVGQSHGGLAALAYGENPYPGTRLIVNFAGGVRKPSCLGWEELLVEAIGDLGRSAQLPSLWFYGDNDSHFPPVLWRAAYGRYMARGGHAKLQAFGTFGRDAHLLLGAREGVHIWLPPLLQMLASAGLPTQVDERFDPLRDVAAGPPVRRVAADDADRLPIRGQTARDAFLHWLRVTAPKAFVISEDGRHWVSAWGEVRPVQRALQRCERLAGARCRVFAVDDDVVWPADSGRD